MQSVVPYSKGITPLQTEEQESKKPLVSADLPGQPAPETLEHAAPNQRVALNTVSRYTSMSITMVTGFLLLPFLLRHIGKSAYGLQALTHQALEFVIMLATAATISYNRIVTTYYVRDDYARMNAAMSAALLLSILVAIFVAISTVFIAMFAGSLFDLPEPLLATAKWVLCLFGVGATLEIIMGVYRTPVFMTQRLYLDSICYVLDVLIPAAIVIPLFIHGHVSILVWVSLSVSARLATTAFIAIPLGRRGLPQLKIRLFAPGSRRRFRELVHFGGLTLIGSLGALLYFATDSIMISNLNELGIKQVVNYNVAQRWFPQISMLAASFVWILGPAMTTQVAVNQFDELRDTVTRATRYCFIILAFPCFVLFIQAEPFLRLWLKDAFVMESVPVMRTIMCALLIGGAGIVSKEALYACRKLRVAVLATLIGGGLNVAISITLVKVGGMGLLGIAVGSLISLFLLQAVCLPAILCHQITLRPTLLLRGALRALLGALPLLGVCLILQRLWDPTSLLQMVLQFATCGLIYLPAVWCISMTRTDREDLRQSAAAAMASWRRRRTRREEAT